MSANGQRGAAPSPPTTLPPNFEEMPGELKVLKNWINWRYLPPKGTGKWRRVPFQPNGRPASTTDRSTWSNFKECCAAYERGGFSGVGFVFDGKPEANVLVYDGV